MLCFTSIIFSFRFRSFHFASMRNKINIFSLCFRLISFSFRFRCEKSEKTLFSHRSKKILLPFRFEVKMMAFFRFCFASFRFKAKVIGVFCFPFALFCFETKIIAIFCFFFVLFLIHSIFVSLQISTFRIDAK